MLISLGTRRLSFCTRYQIIDRSKYLVAFIVSAVATAGLVFAASVGPKADVAAVRAAEHQLAPNNTIVAVHVVGDYAVLHWRTGHAGGAAIFKRVSGERWNLIMGGGGALRESSLVQDGVPASVARQLCLPSC